MHDWQHVSDKQILSDMKTCHKKSGMENLENHDFRYFNSTRSIFHDEFKSDDKVTEAVDVLQFIPIRGACITLSKRGWEPNIYYVLGVDAVLPYEVDQLLFWYFSHPYFMASAKCTHDNGASLWTAKQPNNLPYWGHSGRNWARMIYGGYMSQLGPQRSEEIFYSAAYGFNEEENNPLKLANDGTFIHYHQKN